MAEHTFVITGIGMHTPVGTRAPATCAAIRAGISRVRAWPNYGFAGEPVDVGAIAADGRDASWPEKAVPITKGPIVERAHVGGAIALAAACEALSRGELDAAVVAGFESAR